MHYKASHSAVHSIVTTCIIVVLSALACACAHACAASVLLMCPPICIAVVPSAPGRMSRFELVLATKARSASRARAHAHTHEFLARGFFFPGGTGRVSFLAQVVRVVR